MIPVIYDFEKTHPMNYGNYIFQFIENRILTNTYHSHNYYELIYFFNGIGIQKINDSELECNKNSVTLLRPNDAHCFLKQSENITALSISIQKDEFEIMTKTYDPKLILAIQNQKEPLFYVDFNLSVLKNYIEKKSQDITEYDCKFILSCFLNMYINSTCCLQKRSELPRILSEALNEMKKTENLRQGIVGLTYLSHYSQSHLSRLIKKYFNMTLKEYINELRLQTAYKEIVITQEPLENISEEVGFSSFSHFNKIFKARFSITPSQLRKNYGRHTI